MKNKKYFLFLSIIFIIEFIALAINPYNREDWALENVLVFVSAIIMIISYNKFPLSKVSYTLIFIFMSLHEIGAHYTYAKVPYDIFLLSNFDFSINEYMGWERNNFDRLGHFFYGLLLVYPIKELYCRVANTSGFWAYFLPLELIMASSMMFELFEWGAAEIFGGELGIAYLGTQGDVWDAHKDMFLATLGVLLAMAIMIFINMLIQKNFKEEWKSSLSIKNNNPLGEDEFIRMIKEKK
jgi:putative membrane protein